jgi:hypothetical protein
VGLTRCNECSGRAHPETEALAERLTARFSGCSKGRIYDCTTVAGSDKLSHHAFGRAVDIFPKDKQQGDKIFKWCIDNAERHDIVVVIWYNQIWSTKRQYIHRYVGAHPHTDHVHISQKLLEGYGLKK